MILPNRMVDTPVKQIKFISIKFSTAVVRELSKFLTKIVKMSYSLSDLESRALYLNLIK